MAGATLWLCFEVHWTRAAEAEHRERDAVVRGMEPFIGKYAEKGKIELGADGRMRHTYEGGLLEVNHWGAYFMVPSLGAFAGGFVEITDEGASFEMGLIDLEGGESQVAIAVLEKTNTHSYFAGAEIRHLGVQIDPLEWSDWRLSLRRQTGDGEWETVRSVNLVRYADAAPKRFWRASVSGQSFTPNYD